jgi:glutamate/tyrosine decarboxylase-like PLP-dependent enzyme
LTNVASLRSLTTLELENLNEQPGGGSPLFPTRANRLSVENRLTHELLEARERVAAGRVTPARDLAEFKQELAQFDFSSPKELTDVLTWTIKELERGLVHVTHPRYFGLFNPSPTFPAQCADRIAGAFNPQLASSKTSPAAVEIENHVIHSFVKRMRLPSGAAGHFTSGGSEANFTALVCALTYTDENYAAYGVRGLKGQPTFYVSRESHLAWIKIAHEAGIGRAAVRLIATDGFGRMDVEALRKAIKEDRATGQVPVLIVATAGTTGAGMIDPLAECSAIAKEHNLWCHADAAWGGAVVVSDRLRSIVAGLELADSVTIDAHKWLATTMGCGMFLTRHSSVLTAAFDVSNSYMPSYIPSSDPYLMSAQWSRRFMGLRLFLSLAASGWAGFAEHVEHSVALAAYMRESLESKGWRVVNNSSLAVVCILPPREDANVEMIVSRLLASGRVWVSVAAFEGKKIIRACVTNGETSRADADEFVQSLEEAL